MRIEEFKLILEEKNCDFALFYSDFARINPNLFYFSGYKGIGALIVPNNKVPFLVVPDMELERAKKSMVKKVYPMEKKMFFESIKKAVSINSLKAKNVCIDANNFTLNYYKRFRKQFKKIRAKDISLECLKLRAIKKENEIKILKKSCSYADRILQKTIKNFKDFKIESEASAFLDYESKKKGLELSFSPIVASGSNGSMPHHEPSNGKIKNGFCVIDFGVKYKGYCSDITRTVYLGKPSKKEKMLYNFLLELQKNTISQIKNNKKCSEIYDFANAGFGKYNKHFIHALGHGVGVEIHELPNLTINSKDKMMSDMVFTVEPGLYFPKKFGIRIEDTILLKDKPTILTKTSKELLAI